MNCNGQESLHAPEELAIASLPEVMKADDQNYSPQTQVTFIKWHPRWRPYCPYPLIYLDDHNGQDSYRYRHFLSYVQIRLLILKKVHIRHCICIQHPPLAGSIELRRPLLLSCIQCSSASACAQIITTDMPL